MKAGDFGDLSAELRLLAACMTWPPSPVRSRAVATAAADPGLDWDLFAHAVDRHRATGFAHDGLTRAAVAAPAAFAGAMARRAAADALLNQVFAREAGRLIAALGAAGIDVTVLKGAGLMMQAYGDLGVRHSRDLDLLVPVENIIEAGAICEAADYVRIQPPPHADAGQLAEWLKWRKDFIYRHRTRDVVLELHFRPLVNPRLSRAIDLVADRREVALPGGGTVPAPEGAALYAYLCQHGALCAWFRMKWLADIAALTAGLSDEALTALHQAASARGAARASGQALLLVEAVFDRRLPPGLRQALHADPAVRRLARFAFGVMTDPREPDRVPFRSSAIELSNLWLAQDWRTRRHDVLAWLIDWPLVFSLKLPKVLWFLYPLLRGPAWLLRKLTAAVRRPGA